MNRREITTGISAGLIWGLAWTALALAQPALPTVTDASIAPIELQRAPATRNDPGQAEAQRDWDNRGRRAIGNRIDAQIKRELGDDIDFELNEIETLRLRAEHAHIAAWGLLRQNGTTMGLVRVEFDLQRDSLTPTQFRIDHLASEVADGSEAFQTGFSIASLESRAEDDF